VAVAHARVEQRRHEGQVFFELVHFGPELGRHLARHRLVLELAFELVQLPPVVVDVRVHLVRHDLAHGPVHPVAVLVRELDSDLVELEERLQVVVGG